MAWHRILDRGDEDAQTRRRLGLFGVDRLGIDSSQTTYY